MFTSYVSVLKPWSCLSYSSFGFPSTAAYKWLTFQPGVECSGKSRESHDLCSLHEVQAPCAVRGQERCHGRPGPRQTDLLLAPKSAREHVRWPQVLLLLWCFLTGIRHQDVQASRDLLQTDGDPLFGMLCGSLRNKKRRCQDAKDQDGRGLAGRVLLSPPALHALQISKPESPKSWSSKVVHGCALIPLLMSGNCRQARPRGPNKQGTWHAHSQCWWC